MSTNTNGSTRQVAEWLSKFAAELDRANFNGAADLFCAESYWRDLVSFTWNIKTAEGKDNIKAMLKATVPAMKPSKWQVDGEATTNQGVTECWFTFETEVSRGKGHVRLKEGKCRTLLTTMAELKQFPERAGATRARGAQHGVVQNRKSWLELRAKEEAELGYVHPAILRHHRRWARRDRPWREIEAAGCTYNHYRKEQTCRRFLAKPLQVTMSARPGVVRPLALSSVPG